MHFLEKHDTFIRFEITSRIKHGNNKLPFVGCSQPLLIGRTQSPNNRRHSGERCVRALCKKHNKPPAPGTKSTHHKVDICVQNRFARTHTHIHYSIARTQRHAHNGVYMSVLSFFCISDKLGISTFLTDC